MSGKLTLQCLLPCVGEIRDLRTRIVVGPVLLHGVRCVVVCLFTNALTTCRPWPASSIFGKVHDEYGLTGGWISPIWEGFTRQIS